MLYSFSKLNGKEILDLDSCSFKQARGKLRDKSSDVKSCK